MIRHLFPVFLVIGGCAAEALATFHGDPSFTPDERREIERGRDMIARDFDAEPFPIVWDGRPIDERPSIHRVEAGTWPQAYGGTWRVMLDPDGLDASAPRIPLACAAAHEFGHQHRQTAAHDEAGIMGDTLEDLLAACSL